MGDVYLERLFSTVTEFINENSYDGACHDISAAFHIILEEKNISSELFIGEVKIGDYYVDHSWVGIDNKIYDIAISRPNFPPAAQPPVFASKCCVTKGVPKVIYGVKSPSGFSDIGRWISEVTLGEYSLGHPSRENHLWRLTKDIASGINLDLDINVLNQKYGNKRRVIKNHG
jgi:hypothetical protein